MYSFKFGWTGDIFLHYVEYRVKLSSHLFDVSGGDIRIMVDVNTTFDVVGAASRHCASFSYEQGRMIYHIYELILNISLEFQEI